MDELAITETDDIVLNFYYMNKLYPDYATNTVLEKYLGYNLKEHNLQIAYAAAPYLDPKFKRREILASFAEPQDTESLSLEEQKEKSMENTKYLLGLIKTFDENKKKLSEDIENQVEERNKKVHHKDDLRDLEAFWKPSEKADL